MQTEQLKKIATTLGKFLGILGLIFVFYKLSQDYTFASFISNFYAIAPLLPLLTLLNILSILIGIFVWHMLLQHYTQKPFSFLLSYYYFAKTEIAKYLPGNVFHLIGRQAIAHKIDISQKEMAKISFLFTLNLLIGTVFATTLLVFFAQNTPLYIILSLCLWTLMTLGIIYIFFKKFSLIEKIQLSLYHTLSIILQGLMLGIIVIYQMDAYTFGLFFQIMSIYIISWLIGFVTPGASGGLGVREGTFIAIASFLHLSVDEHIIIFSVLLVRLLNILVDVLLFISTLFLNNKFSKEQHI